jgi:hypothetical protein
MRRAWELHPDDHPGQDGHCKQHRRAFKDLFCLALQLLAKAEQYGST